MRISDWSSDVCSFDLATKTVKIVAKRVGYATAATNPNAVSAANALDALIPTIVQKISDDANGGSVFTTASEIGLVQDAANILSGLDWRLSQDRKSTRLHSSHYSASRTQSSA